MQPWLPPRLEDQATPLLHVRGRGCVVAFGQQRKEPPDVAPAARQSVPPWRDGCRRREPDLSASVAVSAVVALPHGLTFMLTLVPT
jgi:hypothetical protein